METNSEKTITDLELKRGEGVNVTLVSADDIDMLDDSQVGPVDLMSDYWTPQNPGEKKRVIFDRIENSQVLAMDTGELIELECAFFITKENGAVKHLRNGSKRLVGALQTYSIQKGTPLEITYLGKKKNKNGPHSSDNWSLRPLIINIKSKEE
jgi:hypothetical protein